MPIYEYVCNDCGKAFELLVTSSSKPACEFCGSKKIIKQLSVFSAYVNEKAAPACSGGCGGFERGSCGSGCCGMQG